MITYTATYEYDWVKVPVMVVHVDALHMLDTLKLTLTCASVRLASSELTAIATNTFIAILFDLTK